MFFVGNNAGVWRIDETTGGLSAVKWPTFQNENSDTVRTEILTVEARYGGQVDTTIYLLKVNSHFTDN